MKVSPFTGNTNAIVESTISGDRITVFPENQFLNQRPENYIASTKIKKNLIGIYRLQKHLLTYPSTMENFTGEPQGELIDPNKEGVDHRGDIDAGYRKPPVDPKDVIPLPDVGQNFTRAGLEIAELDRKIAEKQKQERREKYETQEKGIQAAEGELQKLIAARQDANRKLLEESQKMLKHVHSMETLAQFFARLGTATPKQEGFAGVLGAGLEAADANFTRIYGYK